MANNCLEAWRAIQQFEALFSNIFPGAQIDQGYLDRRAEYVELAKQNAESLDLPPGSAGDAVLMLDRLVCQRPTLHDQVSTTLLCVHYVFQSSSVFCLSCLQPLGGFKLSVQNSLLKHSAHDARWHLSGKLSTQQRLGYAAQLHVTCDQIHAWTMQ